ncbi:MAG: hemerythrin domain-containing protein, partial [Chlorobi bacterium]|nr:hemerythrin domain-containing protein [Chlorobiota bacterium]
KMVESFFEEYIKEVTEHIQYENDIVFPYVIELFNAGSKADSLEMLKHYAVIDYKKHHSNIEEKLTDLKNLLIKYLPQKGDMPVRREILFDLFELEYDLNIHQKIEDTILIPLVEEIEMKIKKRR